MHYQQRYGIIEFDNFDKMAIAGPNGVDEAIAAGLDLDGTKIPGPMLNL